MLKQRIMTALILIGLLIPALFHQDPQWIALAGLVLIAAAAWEWGRLNSLELYPAMTLAVLSLGVCGFLWANDLIIYFDRSFWLFAGACWVLMGCYLIKTGVQHWSRVPLLLRWLGGTVSLCTTWLALVVAKSFSIDFLLSVLMLVWVADIAAYFAGKAWGKHKLAQGISPGKTWEGVAGAVAGVFCLAFIWMNVTAYLAWPSQSIFNRLYTHGYAVFILGLLFLVFMSIVGDLIESLVKRSAGAKDSSQLLPGHGGVLDRIDALLPTLPLAVMLALV